MTKVNTAEWLLFIDTNIFLDFYRASNDASIRLLQRIDPLHRQIIVSRQVEMEFKKNRQKLMMSFFDGMKPCQGLQSIPAFLRDAASVDLMERTKKELESWLKELKRRSLEMLASPADKDETYKIVHSLFLDTTTGLNLQEDDMELYRTITDRARDRFLLGYPPRKPNDTSCGDAINWEWIVECCIKTGKNVVIVSRDCDYGIIDKDKGKDRCFVNDWLQQEFRSRVSRTRRIVLTDKMSYALKDFADVPVTKDEIEAENVQIAESKASSQLLSPNFADLMPIREQLAAISSSEIFRPLGGSQWKIDSEIAEQCRMILREVGTSEMAKQYRKALTTLEASMKKMLKEIG